MIIAILEADHVVAELQQIHGSYAAMFKRLLSAADNRLTFETFSVLEGNYPEDLEKFDGFLITGSRFSAYDDEPWIDRLKQFVVTLYEQGKPLIGICFGHQLIATALGGETRKATQGWGVGVSTSTLYEKPDWISKPNSNTFNLLVSHQDQVMTLPPDAKLLAGSDFCPIGMYQISNKVLGFQGHPEFSKEYDQALMDRRQDILGERVYKAGIASLEKPVDSLRVAEWMVGFLRQATTKSTDTVF